MKRSQLLIGLAVLLGAIAVSALLRLTKPEAEKKPVERARPVVEVLTLQPETVSLSLPTQGVIEPEKQSLLAAQVTGKVIWAAPQFKAGGEFQEGEELIRIEPSDFEAALAQARATLADAQLNLATEEAKRDQALRDWKALGKGGEPTDLVARKPQLESAKANVESARSNVAQAERNLDRTHIRAPYGLRIQEIQTEVGSFLNTGSGIAQVYALTPLEIRLPLSLDDYAFVGSDREGAAPKAHLHAQVAGRQFEWDAKIVRSEGEVDRQSRSVYLVAQVKPDSKDSILQPGLFVKAEVQGRTLENVFRVPLAAFLDFERLALVNEDDELVFRDVKVARRQGNEALVMEGLSAGDRVCMTALEVVEGMPVKVAGETETPAETPEEPESPPKT